MTVAVIFALVAAVGAGEIELPDPREGHIDGKVAVLYWPHGPGKKLLPADGCEVHLVPLSNPDQELIYPCGEWFQPPPDRYSGWMEQGETMSPAPWLMSYGGGEFRERGMGLVAPVVPAGRVKVPSGSRLAEGQHLRLVHVDSHRYEGGLGRLMDRRVHAGNAQEGVAMPTGDVLAGAFDGDTALALSRPVRVRAGEITQVWPQPPSRGSDVLVVLQTAPGTSVEEPKPSLLIEEEVRSPDLLISGVGRIVAVWYSVEAPSARLRVTSDSSFLPEEQIGLRAGKVTTYRGTLRRRPSLEVSVIAPQDFREEAEVEIDAAGEIHTVPVAINEVTTITNAPVASLRVTLRSGVWRFLETIDLSNGSDGRVEFELKPVRVSGTVFRGRRPAVGAEVGFQVHRGEVVTAETDADGEYGVTLWRKGYYPALIALEGVTGPPVFEFVRVEDGSRIDFHLSDNRYRVRVVDAAAGEPIAGADLRVEQRSGDRESSQSVVTGADGTVTLPPLREGTLTLSARAAGFLESEPRQFLISTDAEDAEILLRLEREQEGHRLRILLSNGTPAGGAEAWIIAEGSPLPLWQGTAEQDGSLAVPLVAGAGILLIHHPEGSSIVRRFHGAAAEQVLLPPSPPLRIRVERRGGGSVRSAALALFLEDATLIGPPLAFFAWSAPLVDGSGIWIGRNLPPRSLRMLATTAKTAAAVGAGGFDSMAATIPYPWPSETALSVLE
jgi:hypothetical protein